MYHCRTLTKEEITDNYNKHMKNDFTKDELKPLSRIIFSLDKDQYICYGIFNDDTLCGYAYFASIIEDGKTYYLLDYFATVEEFRGQGIGSEFLSLLYDKISNVEMVLCEAETPDVTTGDEYNIRSRRITFYLNNNFIDTGVTASAFGVDFVLLELDLGRKHTHQDIGHYYAELYRSFLPEKLFNKFIKI